MYMSNSESSWIMHFVIHSCTLIMKMFISDGNSRPSARIINMYVWGNLLDCILFQIMTSQIMFCFLSFNVFRIIFNCQVIYIQKCIDVQILKITAVGLYEWLRKRRVAKRLVCHSWARNAYQFGDRTYVCCLHEIPVPYNSVTCLKSVSCI